jgi:FkbM family methyltransferase
MTLIFLKLVIIFTLNVTLILGSQIVNSHGISNRTISGDVKDGGCKHAMRYDSTSVASFPMCTGQTDQDLKNGMSIINLIGSRGYLPTCRILQLLLWMSSEVHENKQLSRETFVDIGANIGSCTVAIASLGFPVVSAEPVQQHVDTIRGSMSLNPSFHIELNHIGISVAEKKIKANFGHGSRNWGATEFHEADGNSTYEVELRLKTVDQVIGTRKVSLMKVDCEGCEWAAIKGARRSLRKIPMIKLELVQPSYTAGNETVSASEVLQYLQKHGYEIYTDVWAENSLYFGNRGKEILDTDRMFGSKRFKLTTDLSVLEQSAKKILTAPIDVANFDQKLFLSKATDIIAIEKSLADRMKLRWLDWKQ